MPDEAPLREFARFAIRDGRLPRRDPAQIWGGPGVGAFCGVCEKPITQDQLEYEFEFAGDGDNPKRDKVHFHLRCFAAWEFERTKGATGSSLPGSAPGRVLRIAAGQEGS
jgi:hypothetical protein